MKTFFKILLILSFAFTIQFFLAACVFVIGGFTPNFLKSTLVTNKVYETVAAKIQQITIKDDSGNTDDLILPFIKEQFSSEYIQKKSEGLIDDTTLWITGATSTPPVLSFSEVKTAIEDKNPELLTQLKEMSSQMKKEQAQSDVPADSAQSNFDLDKILNSDFKIPVGEKIGFLKQAYSFFKLSIPLVGIYLLALLGIIMLLSPNSKSRLKWIGATFLVAVFFGILPVIFSYALAHNPMHFNASGNEFANIASNIGSEILKSFAGKLFLTQLVGGGIMSVLAVICFTIGNFTSPPKTKVRKKK